MKRIVRWGYNFYTTRLSRKPSIRFSAETNFLVNNRFCYIYCPIPKVACSSFKKVLLLTSDYEPKSEVLEQLHSRHFHDTIHNLFALGTYDVASRNALLQDERYFKFAIVRNPWIRLHSAYLDKFVRTKRLEDFTHLVILKIAARRWRKEPLEKGITFREFIDYVTKEKDMALDVHWRPQYIFLGNTQFNYIGKFEVLDQVYLHLKERLGIDIELPWLNRVALDQITQNKGKTDYADEFSGELKKYEVLPGYRCFYNKRLIEQVGNRYKKDIQLFSYSFS